MKALTLSDMHMAMDIAHSIAGATACRRMAGLASVNNIILLARGVLALEQIARSAALLVVSQESAAGFLERVPEETRLAVSAEVNAAVTLSRHVFAQELAALGFVTITDKEETHGTAGTA